MVKSLQTPCFSPKLRRFKQRNRLWSLANIEVKLLFAKKNGNFRFPKNKETLDFIYKTSGVRGQTSACLILSQSWEIIFPLQTNIALITISAGKGSAIPWSTSTIRASLLFFIRLWWLSLFSPLRHRSIIYWDNSYSSDNCREDRAYRGSKCISGRTSRLYPYQLVEDHFLYLLMECACGYESRKIPRCDFDASNKCLLSTWAL